MALDWTPRQNRTPFHQWSMMMREWRWPHFSRDEMKCRCGCNQCEMSPAFMDILETIRMRYGRPMRVSSGYRCEEHNRKIGGGPEHVLGKAADILVSGSDAMDLVQVAVPHVARMGFSQKGAHESRFIHLGTAAAGEVAGCSPWVWSY